MAKAHTSNCVVHRSWIGFFASWTREDERLRAHCCVCFMLSVMLWSHDGKGPGRACGCPIPVGCAREAVMLAMGVAYRSSTWLGLTTPLSANMCNAVRFCFLCTLRNFIYWIGEERTCIVSSFCVV